MDNKTTQNQLAIRTSVGAVIFKQESVLLIRRGKDPYKGHWSIPGGGLEYGETLHNAVHREVMEETGVTIKILELLNVYEALPDQRTAPNTTSQHYLMIDYICAWQAGDPVAGDDADEARFFTMDKALALISWDMTRTAVRDAYTIYSARMGQ